MLSASSIGRNRKRSAPPAASAASPLASRAADRRPGASTTANPSRNRCLHEPSSGVCSRIPRGASSDQCSKTARPRAPTCASGSDAARPCVRSRSAASACSASKVRLVCSASAICSTYSSAPSDEPSRELDWYETSSCWYSCLDDRHRMAVRAASAARVYTVSSPVLDNVSWYKSGQPASAPSAEKAMNWARWSGGICTC
mmetsp:Transcript_4126/g.12771  ORF Transcript_4126/g.12771 Transcript_4126/m.12771 type:complete len:200 (-) Transcript_4126:409-1008(-)